MISTDHTRTCTPSAVVAAVDAIGCSRTTRSARSTSRLPNSISIASIARPVSSANVGPNDRVVNVSISSRREMNPAATTSPVRPTTLIAATCASSIEALGAAATPGPVADGELAEGSATGAEVLPSGPVSLLPTRATMTPTSITAASAPPTTAIERAIVSRLSPQRAS